MPHLFYIVFFLLLGACIGSFLNVVVWRLPRGESLIYPLSRCPICQTRLAWYDNIPIFGWLFLRGRCRYCHAPVSIRYPVIELVTGLLFVFYYVMFFIAELGPCAADPQTRWSAGLPTTPVIPTDLHVYLLYVFAVSALLAASLIDAQLFWIPQSIPLVMAGVGILFHAMLGRPPMPGSINVNPHGFSAPLAAGGTLGLIAANILLRTGLLSRSFAAGYPELEIEKDPLPNPQPGWLGRFTGRWVDRFRGKLSPAEQAVMEKATHAARDRDQQLEREHASQQAAKSTATVASPPKEFTSADIRREMRLEMLFLMIPMATAFLAVLLKLKVPAFSAAWESILTRHDWLTGLLGALLGALIGGFVVWLVRILGSMAFGREAMGMGDVDLMLGVGAIIGAGGATLAFFAAPFFGIAVALYTWLIGKRRELPYGPYLSLGSAFAMLYYCDVARWLGPGFEGLVQLVRGGLGG